MKGEKEQSKYPQICVPLKDEGDTAFQLLVRVRTALRDAGIEKTAQDFEHLVFMIKRWVETTRTDEVEI